jgi:NADPH:quinone reductase-like Zn-dependent oxidoreductase
VQFARLAGAHTIGTGSSRNRDFVLGLGANDYVDYTSQDVAEAVSGVHVALDTVGAETTHSLLPTLREGGILVTIASAPPTEAAQRRGVRAELLVTSPSSEQLARVADLVIDKTPPHPASNDRVTNTSGLAPSGATADSRLAKIAALKGPV